MEIEKVKGCVYFFKHVGLSPVKIGFSTNESPFSRFNSFKTYAPFGSELIGFIRTEKPKELETILHQKFSSSRLNGEWFEISKDEVDKCIKFYSDMEDIQEMNNFQVAWAKKIQENRIEEIQAKSLEIDGFSDLFSLKKNDLFTDRIILNQVELLGELKIEKSKLKEFAEANKMEYKCFRVENSIKKGYCLYKKP